MTENDADRDGRRILLMGHGLSTGLLTRWSTRHAVELHRLPVPAFELRPSGALGRPKTPQVAERLAELDELEEVFERIAIRVAAGDRVLGLAVPARLTASRSGCAWIDRVRSTAAGIAGLSLEVWTIAEDRSEFEPADELIRSAS